jgi:hypothetical protein
VQWERGKLRFRGGRGERRRPVGIGRLAQATAPDGAEGDDEGGPIHGLITNGPFCANLLSS